MPTVQRSIEIRAPPPEVFVAATDPNRGSEWNPNVQTVGAVAVPIGAGSEWQQTAMAMGKELRLTCTVVRFQPPDYGELSITGDQRGRTVTRCEPLDDGTRLTQSLEFAIPGGLVGRLMGGMVETMLGRELEQSLQRIKLTLEMETGRANGSRSTG